MSSGLCLHTSTTLFMNNSGSCLKLSMAYSSENTQYHSLNLKTPKFGLPGISKPFFEQMVKRQKPKKSRGMCIKSGVLLGISLKIGFDGSPIYWLSTVYATWFSYSVSLPAFSTYKAFASLMRCSGSVEVASHLYSSSTLKSSFLKNPRCFSSSNCE